MGVSKLFDISKRTLSTYQQALSVTSNNISNADNENYSRQRTVLSSVAPDTRGVLTFGSGVTVADIERVRNQIVDMQVYQNTQDLVASEKQATILSNVETVFSEPSDTGLSNLINEFFNAWDELAADPTSTSLRNSVIYAAENMTGKLQSVYEGISKVKNDLKSDSQSIVDELNAECEELQTINEQIYTNSVIGYGVNDLLDKRDELLRSMSEKANLNVSIDENGVANVSIGGVFAVDQTHYTTFKVVEESADGKLTVKTEDGNAKLALKGGELYANTNSYNNYLPAYLEELDKVGVALMDGINAVHNTGYSISDPADTGIDFFTNYTDGVLKINEQIVDDVKNIAISADGTDGNNEIALQISELRDSGLIDGETIDDTYNNLVSDVAGQIQYYEQQTETYQLVVDQLDSQITSYSGVSVDEEMVDVLKFQRSYEAAAKLISIADEMLQTLINI